jgi:predicted nucleic acid-binding protein
MIVVGDTAPLNYLIQIGCDFLLLHLYQHIVVPAPAGAMKELGHAATLASVRVWLSSVPAWIDVREITSASDTALVDLDLGEREAIQLAEEQHADSAAD